MSDFASANLTVGQLNAIVKKLGGENGALRFLRGEIEVVDKGVVLDWSSAYEKFGLREQYEAFVQTLAIPTDPNRWLIPVLDGVTCNQVVSTLKNLSVNFYLNPDDLDKTVTHNDRNAKNGSYAVTCQAVVEADEANEHLSADDCKKQGILGITLLERLLLELAYFMATGEHLDVNNATICAGSRYAGGHVPEVYWRSDNRKVNVNWSSVGNSNGSLRARSVTLVPELFSEGIAYG